MRKPFFVALLLALAAVSPRADAARYARSTEGYRPWAVGFELGEPTGLTLKRYLGGGDAFDLNFGFAYGPGIRFSADYLWGLAHPVISRSVDLGIYVGAGPMLGSFRGACGAGWFHDSCNGDVYAGVRAPIGVELLFHEIPLTVGLEAAPALAFANGGGGFLLDADLIARIRF